MFVIVFLCYALLVLQIPECDREGKEDDESQDRISFKTTPSECTDKSEISYTHQPTPLHQTPSQRGKSSNRKRAEPNNSNSVSDDRGISCNKCRPSSREKISVVPVENTVGRHSITSPNGLFRSIFSSLVKKSPRSLADGASPREMAEEEEPWKVAVAELSHKLIQVTKKRDEAILESSRLKHSMAELEKKLNKLETYCHSLRSGLEVCTNKSQQSIDQIDNGQVKHRPIKVGDHDKVIEHFLVSVSESRQSVRYLSRSLTLQLRQIGGKVYDRIAILLQPHDIKISLSRNPRGLLVYLEALLNKAFFEDFESSGFQKGGSNQVLNPIQRCEANFNSFTRLKELSWDEVLIKGTKQFSEDFSKFCDRKMSEIVAMLGWTQAWPEPLLQSFFAASKSVWLVHLLANSVHPSLPIFRVDKMIRFDSVYMEDMGGDKARKLVPNIVRIMVEPGFYVYGNVVKCKVLCRYQNNNGINNDYNKKGLNSLSIE